ncbi:MAG: hypothetical protein IT364_27865 [Candidatus Hydrogenedentes bacterium]|nr:hypothetical protein [Candidatus Hydrogenedentota bacterium]
MRNAKNPDGHCPGLVVERGHELTFYCPDGCKDRCPVILAQYQLTAFPPDENICVVIQCDKCRKVYIYKIYQGPYTRHTNWQLSWFEQLKYDLDFWHTTPPAPVPIGAV